MADQGADLGVGGVDRGGGGLDAGDLGEAGGEELVEEGAVAGADVDGALLVGERREARWATAKGESAQNAAVGLGGELGFGGGVEGGFVVGGGEGAGRRAGEA